MGLRFCSNVICALLLQLSGAGHGVSLPHIRAGRYSVRKEGNSVDDGLIYRNDGNRPLLAMLSGQPGSVLDCGCGPGDNARLLKELGWRVTGVTMDVQERTAALPFCDDVLIADLERGLHDNMP